jgi:hypothetical protein
MVWERRFLLDQETQSSDAATRRVKLPREGFVSGLELRTRITNGANAGEEHIVDAIDRVEIIGDGSFVIFSLEGVELLRWGWWDLRRFPPQQWDESANAVQELVLPIFFGRYLGDPQYALNLGAWRDVELRIAYSPTIGANAFATGTTQFHIPMTIDDSGESLRDRRGWLRTQQIYAFTSAGAGEEVIDLAQQFPYAAIMVYAREDAVEDGVDITRVQLFENDRKRAVWDARWDDLQTHNQLVYDIDPAVNLIANRADNAAIDLLTGRIQECHITIEEDLAAGADFHVYNPASVAGDRLTLHGFTVEGSATYQATTLDSTRRKLYITAKGVGIGNAVVIPFQTALTPEGMYDPRDKGRVQLVLTNGGAGADVRVSTREIVPA